MNTAIRPGGSHWWLPSLSVCLWLAFFLAIQLSAQRQFLISTDGGASLHWRIGGWMLDNHAIIRADPLSYTRAGAEVVSKEWLSELLIATMGNWLGWGGIVMLAATLIATCFWLLHRMLLSEGCELLLATGLTGLAAAAASLHWQARPLLVTHLLALVFMWQLRGFERGRVPGWQLFAGLVPLMMLWANLHGAFFTGLVMIGIYTAGSAVNRDWHRTRTLVLLGAACLAVTLFNPNGWKLPAIVMHYLRSHSLVDQVDEFMSPSFHSDLIRGFVAQLFVLALLLLVARPKLGATDLCLIAVWGYFALVSLRNIPIFALVVTPILAEHWNAFFRARPDSPVWRLYRKVFTDISAMDRVADGRALMAVASIVMILALARSAVVTELLPTRFPVEAVKRLQALPVNMELRMFSPDFWGGYLALVMPERKVFLDDRHEFYGDNMIRDYQITGGLTPQWPEPLARHRVNVTVLPSEHALNQLLALSPGWRRMYSDGVTTMYEKIP